MLGRARQELESGVSVARFEVDASTGLVQPQRYELRLVGTCLQIRCGTATLLELSAIRVAHARLGAASTCTELLRRSGQTHLPPLAQPWRCFHFSVLGQAGGSGTADVVVHAEPYYCASPTSRQARLAVLALMTLELAHDSCGRYKLLHKAAATRDLLAAGSATQNCTILPRGSELLVHEIRTADGRPRARTDFGWVSVISQGGRTMLEPIDDSGVLDALRPRPGLLLCDTAKLHLEALVPPGPFRRHGLLRVVASLLRQVARGVTLQHSASYKTAKLPATQRGWEQLTSAEQVAAQTFGRSYSSWRLGMNIVPSWACLDEVERSAAAALKFDEQGWNALREQQTARVARRKETRARRSEWLALDDVERSSALWLGWSSSTWGQGSRPTVCSFAWTELSRDEREAAETLGWSPTTWHEDSSRHSRQNLVAASGMDPVVLPEDGAGDYFLHVDTASIRVDALDSGRVGILSGCSLFCRVWLNGKLVGDTLSVPAVLVPPIRALRADPDSLREQLSKLGLKDLRRQAIGAGVSNDALEDALECEDPHKATLAITIETMLGAATPQVSVAGDLQPSNPASDWVPVELQWAQQIRLHGVAHPPPAMTTLRVELHLQSMELQREPSETVVRADTSTMASVNDCQISPPSREELDAKLGQLLKRDSRLANSFTLSPYKGVSASIATSTSCSTPLRALFVPDEKSETEPERTPDREPTYVGGASGDTSVLGVVILRSHTRDGFPRAAASYILQPWTSCSPPVGVEGTVRLWVSSPEEANKRCTVAPRSLADEKLASQTGEPSVGSPVLGHHVRVSRDCVSWAALAVHEQSSSSGRQCDSGESPLVSSSTSIDAMVSKFGAPSAEIQGVPLVVVDPFLADTDSIANAGELKDAVVLCGRGNIAFAEKAKRLQTCGAAAVVFVNTEDEPFCPMYTGSVQPDADDHILIPSVCIQKTVGQSIVDRVREDEKGTTLTVSLIIGELPQDKLARMHQSTVASVASGSSSCKQGSPKASTDTRANAREVSMALATPDKTGDGAVLAEIGADEVSTQPTAQSLHVDSILPDWEERHTLRLQAFAQLRPIMQLFVAKHAVPHAGASCRACATVRPADVKRMATALLPYCDQDRVVPACRRRCIDNKADEFSVDVVVSVFLSAAFLPSARGEWDHLCDTLSKWETWVVRRCEVVKATLVFEDLEGAGMQKGTIREGEQVEVLESALNARGNVMSRVRCGETHEEGWATAVKKNGAVLLIPSD